MVGQFQNFSKIIFACQIHWHIGTFFKGFLRTISAGLSDVYSVPLCLRKFESTICENRSQGVFLDSTNACPEIYLRRDGFASSQPSSQSSTLSLTSSMYAFWGNSISSKMEVAFPWNCVGGTPHPAIGPGWPVSNFHLPIRSPDETFYLLREC